MQIEKIAMWKRIYYLIQNHTMKIFGALAG